MYNIYGAHTSASKESRLYDFIEQNNIATTDEMDLVTGINGWSLNSLWDIIYQRTGLRNMDQLESEGYINTDEELDR